LHSNNYSIFNFLITL